MSNNPLSPVLYNLAATIRALEPQLLQALGDAAVAATNENFRNQGFNGIKWDPRAKKDKKRPGRAILVDSTHLENSIHIVSIGPGTVSIGSDLPYARIHNEGGEIRHPYRVVDLYYSKDKNGKLRLAKTGTIGQQMKATEHRRSSSYNHVTRMPRRQFLGNAPNVRKLARQAVLEPISQSFRIIK